MAKRAGGKHSILGYIKDLIIGIILVGIILWLCGLGLVDQKRHTPAYTQNMENNVKNSAVKIYQRNNGPLQKYVQERTNGDLRKYSPQVKQVGQLPKWSFNKAGQAQVSNVSMDDTGNGTFDIRGHKYLFQLADIQFAPHNSQFYKKNHNAMQADIQHEVGSGSFKITKDAHHQIDLWKNGHSVAGAFIGKGIAYVPDLTTHHNLVATEKIAKAKKVGFWSIPNVVSGNQHMQAYSISAENGHKVPVAGVSSTTHGGQTLSQKLGNWFNKH